MATYQVTISRTAYVTYTVEADNPESAEEQAWEKYNPQDADDCASNDIYEVEEIDSKSEDAPQLIQVEGFWHDTKQTFEATCMVGEWDGEPDDAIMFYFDSIDQIIGNHGDFTITNYTTDI